MRERLTFSATCPILECSVELATDNWKTEIDSENEVIHYRAQCVCGNEHVGFATKPRKVQPSEVRGYVLNSFLEMWQKPAGKQIFSEFADGKSYVCMTSKAINFWHEGQLTSCNYSVDTKARYDLILQRAV